MKQKHNYFVLKKPGISFWQSVLFFIKIPYLLIKWTISFLLARNITHLALDPTRVKEQKTFNLVHLADDDDVLVVNLFPHEPYKTLNDYLLKFSGSWFKIPFLTLSEQRQLSYDNADDREHIDHLLREIALLLKGKSANEEFSNKKFSWESIHFKGLPCLDDKMRAYFMEKLFSQFGDKPFQSPKHNLNFFTLETGDYSVLDSVEVIGEGQENIPISERKFVITCMARDQNYFNWLKDFNYSAQEIGCTLIGFNYRGVDYSKGVVWTQNNMVDDALAQVERLIELGAKPENIGLEGMCVGSSIATIAAAKLHEQGLKVKLYNERCFRSIPRFITGFILPKEGSNPWNPLNILRTIVAGLVFIITYPFIWIADWDLDAADAWDRIPFEDKDYSFIRQRPNSENSEGQLDEVIHDTWASITSHIEEKQAEIRDKLDEKETLDSEEEKILNDPVENHSFHVAPGVEFKVPHVVPRRNLNASSSPAANEEPMNMHQHMVSSFVQKFSKPPSSPPPLFVQPDAAIDNCSTSTIPNSKGRPLLIASSGGGGHIFAMQGLMKSIEKANDSEVEFVQHQAPLFSEQPSSIGNSFLRFGIYLSSLWGFGYVINKIARGLGSFGLPNSELFWEEIERLEQNEQVVADVSDSPLRGRHRPYVDMLLDVHRSYEAVATYNALHRNGQTDDINRLLQQEKLSDYLNYQTVYEHFLNLLIDAAEKGQPYTEIISTQPLSLPALCDAVIQYNTHYLKKNSQSLVSAPPVAVHQYLTDLPSIACDQYCASLAQLTSEQKQQMHLYVINLRKPILLSYFENGKDFQGLHNMSFIDNPLIREGFKDENLDQYLDQSQEFVLNIKNYARVNSDWLLNPIPSQVVVPSNSKVASVMLSSLGSDATVDYVAHLLKHGYDQIFVFSGLNNYIYQKIEELIHQYPVSEHETIRSRIIRLGNQDDTEIAPIMTRSNCVIIRGGMSAMEQAALPLHSDKMIFIDQANLANSDDELGPDVNWEDGNANELISYLKTQHIYAKKTSPQRIDEDLDFNPPPPANLADEHGVLNEVQFPNQVDGGNKDKNRTKFPRSFVSDPPKGINLGRFTTRNSRYSPHTHPEQELNVLPRVSL